MNLLRRLLPGIALVTGAFLLSVGLQTFAFTEPSAGPTGGTVYPPLNTGSNWQSKAGGLNINASGATAYGLVVPSGNVGIGTASPATPLHIHRATGDAVYVTANGTASASIWFANNYDATKRWAGIGVSGTDSALRFTGGDSSFSDADTHMIITNTSNVGIGTTAPGYKLSVVGDVNATGCFRINGTCISSGGSGTVTSVGAYQGLQTNTSNPFTTSGFIGLNISGISSCTNSTNSKIYWNGSQLVCGQDQNSGGGGGYWAVNGSHIYNTNSGNVGIGTTGPGSKLTIGGPAGDLALQNGAIYVNSSYTPSQLQLYGQDVRTTNDANLYLNWTNASGGVVIGGEGENKVLYMGGGSGAMGSGSYIDTADYYIRSKGKWVTQMIDFSAAGSSINITPTNSIQTAQPGGISGSPKAAILNFTHESTSCNDSVIRLYKGTTDLGNILGRVSNGTLDLGGAFAIVPLTNNNFGYKESWRTSGFCAVTVRTIGFIY
jgi:hypothetical protein